MEQMPVTLTELYALIGEREVIKYKLGEKVKELFIQIDEMAKTITEVREQEKILATENQELKRRLEEHGKLEQPDDHDAIRRIR